MCIVCIVSQVILTNFELHFKGRRGRDRMVAGFTITCAISAYHRYEHCEFDNM
jgi:hypothetical protein